MLLLVNPELVMREVMLTYRDRIAAALQVASNLVVIRWEKRKDGTVFPEISVSLPPAIPPATVDVNDPQQMEAWQREVADMPGIEEFLKARGVDDPGKVLDLYVKKMVAELRIRMTALMGPTA